MSFPAVDQKAWRARVEAELAGEGFEASLVTRTLEGLTIAPLYGPDDRPKLDSGVPGSAPFVRGGRPPNGRRWRIAADIGAPDPAVAAGEVRQALATGADALLVRFDRAGRLGLAHHTASNTVGVGGVALVDRADLAEVLAGVDLERTPIALDAGANALPAAALFVADAWTRELAGGQLRAHLGADVHGALAYDGALPGDLRDARRELVDLTVYSRMHLEHVRAIAVDARPWHRAGGHAVQELGLALAGFVETLRWLQDELPPAASAGEVVFRVDVGRDLSTEVAKLRALRLLYAKVMAAAGVPVPAAPVLHVFTSPRGYAQRDPHTNLLRGTLGTFAAAIGGADWITTAAFDAAQPTVQGSALGRRLALTTQLVLAEECQLGHVADPLGGAYQIEARTLELARAGYALMQDIERRGGLAKCIATGYVEEQLGASREALSAAIARHKWPITGVSEFPLQGERLRGNDESSPTARHATARGEAAKRATEREAARMRERGRLVLGDVQSVEHTIEAAARGATLAELGSALVRGVPLERRPLPHFREAAPFEALRDAADAAATPPRVFLACLGPLAEHAMRALFAANFFAAGGFDVVQGIGTQDAAPDDAARALVAERSESGADVVCLCGSDAAYSTHALAALGALHEAGVRWTGYAGQPQDTQHDSELRDVGVDAFVYVGCDALEALGAALAALDIELQPTSRAAHVAVQGSMRS
jgi:methylmalonyl-CoA mutase